MSKRFKILSLSTSLVLCVSLFLIGVFAASSVSLNVSSTISFKSEGAYVMATGQVYRGTNTEIGTGSELEETDRPSEDTTQNASYTYLGYSYTPVGSGDDVHLPDGSPSTDLPTWNIGMLEFLSNEPVLKYEIVFKNYGINNLSINITGIPENSNNVKIENTNLPLLIPSGKTKTFTLTARLTNFYESFDGQILNLNCNIENYIGNLNYYTCICKWNGGSYPYPGDGIQILVDNEVKLTLNSSEIYSEGYNDTFEIIEGAIITYNVLEENNEKFSIQPRAGNTNLMFAIWGQDNQILATLDYSIRNGTIQSTGFPLVVTEDIRIEWEGTG